MQRAHAAAGAPVIYFAPEPPASELPARFPSPFASAPPHALAQRAADELKRQLRSGDFARELDTPGGGKMFGVLVVTGPGGRIGYLRGFSGMLGGRWRVDGFVPPLFDPIARDAFWPAGERQLAALGARIRELAAGDESVALRAALAEMSAHHAAALAELKDRHRQNRQGRRAARRRLASDSAGETLEALAQQSRADKAEHRRLAAALDKDKEALTSRIAAIDVQRSALQRLRAARSKQLLRQIHATYRITNALGERRPLRALFVSGEPPGGTGDCTAPKLLGHAYSRGLKPHALAEFWWGAPPVTGGRHPGVYYPPCRGKCGPLLAFMLQGLDADAPPLFGAGASLIAAAEPRTVFEDPWLAIVDKPCGLLSVPGRSSRLKDSVLVRLRERYPDATGALLVHRLDLDTSGLMLVAKTAEMHAALQRLFSRREVEKRYIAWLDGEVALERGVIELALRVDLNDRPRQIHDPVHGKPAITEWQVLERSGGRTKVALYPRTGRTHQLRMHASHPRGIGAPIAGDRLYGRPGERLMLHAEALSFMHPQTHQYLKVRRPAPF